MSATLTHGVDATALDAVPTDLLIGGRWTPAEGGRTLAVEDPATGEFLAGVADASPGDGRAALDAADGARESWAGAPARERAELVRRGGGPHRRPLRAVAERRQPDPRLAPARRPMPAHHALELPARDGHAQGRAGPRCGLHRGAQAGRPDAAHRPRVRAAHARRGPASRRAERGHDLKARRRRVAPAARRPAAEALL